MLWNVDFDKPDMKKARVVFQQSLGKRRIETLRLTNTDSHDSSAQRQNNHAMDHGYVRMFLAPLKTVKQAKGLSACGLGGGQAELPKGPAIRSISSNNITPSFNICIYCSEISVPCALGLHYA